jgi:DNA-binding MurR/RpiR family transcriptional regulator
VEVSERIRIHSASLTAAERRVAEAILRSPQAVGFGTVADLADSAKVGAASVVRLASKLGFDGYSDLQASIQHDLLRQLRPAVERIEETLGDGPRSAHAAVELANVRATIEAADSRSIEQLTSRVADLGRPVVILSGEASAGVAQQFTDQLEQLRDDVRVLGGSDVAVRRAIAVLPSEATAVVIDLRRYERWVLDAHASLRDRGVWSAAFTDSILSPLAARADVTFVVSADSVGPFDSHVGTLALLNLIGAEVAGALRSSARDRLAAVEEAWSRHGSLTESS